MEASDLYSISNLESINLSQQWLELMNKWENSSAYPYCGFVTSRVIGAPGTIVTLALDTIVHSSLAVTKTITGVIVLPYNCIAKCLSPRLQISDEWSLSSAMLHLALVINDLFSIVLVPFLTLLDPRRALIFISRSNKALLNLIESKKKELEKLQEELREKEGAIQDFNRSLDALTQEKLELEQMQPLEDFDLRTLTQQLQDNKHQYLQIESEKVKIQKELEVLKQELKQTSQVDQIDLDKTTKEKDLLIQQLTKQKEDLETEILSLKSEIEKNKQCIGKQLEDIQTLNHSKSPTLNQEDSKIIQLESKQNVERENTDLNQQMTELNEKLQQMETDKKEFEKEKSQLLEQMNNSKQENQILSNQLEELKSKIESQSLPIFKKIEASSKKIEDFKLDNNQSEKKLNQIQEVNEKLQSCYDQLLQRMLSMESEKSKNSILIEQLQAQLNQKEEEIKELKQQILEFQITIAAQQIEIGTLEDFKSLKSSISQNRGPIQVQEEIENDCSFSQELEDFIKETQDFLTKNPKKAKNQKEEEKIEEEFEQNLARVGLHIQELKQQTVKLKPISKEINLNNNIKTLLTQSEEGDPHALLRLKKFTSHLKDLINNAEHIKIGKWKDLSESDLNASNMDQVLNTSTVDDPLLKSSIQDVKQIKASSLLTEEQKSKEQQQRLDYLEYIYKEIVRITSMHKLTAEHKKMNVQSNSEQAIYIQAQQNQERVKKKEDIIADFETLFNVSFPSKQNPVQYAKWLSICKEKGGTNPDLFAGNFEKAQLEFEKLKQKWLQDTTTEYHTLTKGTFEIQFSSDLQDVLDLINEWQRINRK